MNENIFFELSRLVILAGAIWALIQFWSANEFKKAQYLSELWRKFYTTDKFVELFSLLDKEDDDINLESWNTIQSKDIFSYLAFLEEIVLFRRTNFFHIYKISDKNLIIPFQYHFYNIYIKDTKCRKLFWKKIEDELDTNQSSWKFQKDFANKCNSFIKKNQI